LGYRSAGGNWRTIKKYAEKWHLSVSHFDPAGAALEGLRRSHKRAIPLEDVMVPNSTYNRAHLKRRLLSEGIKQPNCERCGQGEIWRGERMALILDHINGVPNDHRLENLRILCPNCAATLATHCGRKNTPQERTCPVCGNKFVPRYKKHRYCSRACGTRWDRSSLRGVPRLSTRRVERPPYEQLMREIEETSYLAVGRKYGVSDNAIRKWVRQYERELESDAA
jgi:hypothetical protein